ncbi:MAG TPA: ammonia channel protein, partial [Burkholderiales bacterium]|nr:ammonia channel protein [Burkholderiales bacterium]
MKHLVALLMIMVALACAAGASASTESMLLAQASAPAPAAPAAATSAAAPAATPAATAAPAPAAASAAPAPAPNKGDTAWMIVATALVVMMSIPGLALFYGGLVRSKNMLSVLMQVFVIFSMIVVLWAIYGYSLAFTEG